MAGKPPSPLPAPDEIPYKCVGPYAAYLVRLRTLQH